MNYFAHKSAAKRYANARPYFHPIVMQRIKAFLNLQQPLQNALDVGCGTGQSTVALKAISNEIVGTDSSQEMLNEARLDSRIRYICSPAEQLPFPDASFDLVTVASAFHWLDRQCFLTEASRVLHLQGWLIIYGNGFTGKISRNPALEHWSSTTYLERYPIPPRNNQPLTEGDTQEYSLCLLGREHYINDVTFTPKALADYLMTQSNVIASVEQGKERAEDAHMWLVAEVAPLFQSTSETFTFGGAIEYLQKERHY